jgi:hypothetical protein
MNPLLTLILGEIVKQAPSLAIELLQILSKPGVTDDDWNQLKARYATLTYDGYIAAAARTQVAAASPPGSPPAKE